MAGFTPEKKDYIVEELVRGTGFAVKGLSTEFTQRMKKKHLEDYERCARKHLNSNGNHALGRATARLRLQQKLAARKQQAKDEAADDISPPSPST